MKRILSLLVIFSLLFFFINCPQENKEPTAQEKAAAQKSIASLNIAMQKSMEAGMNGQQTGVSNPMYATSTYTVNETLQASTWGGSGTVSISGTVSEDGNGNFSITMKITFTNYTYQGITINGSCNMNCTATETPLTFNMSYDGSFKVTGEYNMDISIKETFKMTETTLSYTATVTIEGKEWTESRTINL